jgi:hypothetical protein
MKKSQPPIRRYQKTKSLIQPTPAFTRPASSRDMEDPNSRLNMETAETHRTIGTYFGISLTGIDVRNCKTKVDKDLGNVIVVGSK